MKPDSRALPLDALEHAARAMLEAVQMMRAVSSPDAFPPHATVTTPGPVTLIGLANEFLISKARAGRSDNYLKCLRAEPGASQRMTLKNGVLPLRQSNNRLCDAVKRGAVPWGKSVTRHSFYSYHLAEFKSAAATALEAGHTEQMLFNHYREIVTPAQSQRFWAIHP